ncbi:MAG: MBL fold metallo-hydrolase [Gammaproteobacteria bacterium]|nr:MBL fold metallo-hydrolase [Gammaproteobacteria bacterium]
MLDTFDVGHGITCIDTGYTRPEMTACYLMQQGGAAAFIETGVNRNVAGLLEILDSKGIAREAVNYIMPTHVHLDHAGGSGALMNALPNAQLIMHPRGARHMIDPSKLAEGVKAVYGEEYFTDLFGVLMPVDEGRVIVADDGFVLDFEGRKLEFLDTPGHARHHYCVVDELSGGIFTGDTMGLSYPQLRENGYFAFPTTTPVQFDPQAMHASIDRITQYQPDCLYLTHFGRIDEVESHVEQLHRDVDQLVEIVKRQSQSGIDESELISAIGQYLLERAQLAGCELPPPDIEELLAPDVKLNVQGLLHWANH